MFIETQMGNKIKYLRSNNGGEYVNEELKTYCKEHSIYIEYTAPHSLHQNGIAEIQSCHHQGCTYSTHSERLTKVTVVKVIRHIRYLNNRTPYRALTKNITLYEVFTKKKPNLDGIQEFGTKC